MKRCKQAKKLKKLSLGKLLHSNTYYKVEYSSVVHLRIFIYSICKCIPGFNF